MAKKIGKKISLIICAFAVALVSAFSAFAPVVNVVYAAEFKEFLPQAGSNFRLSQINTASHDGLTTIKNIHSLVREFWKDYNISYSGSSSSNSMLNACNRVYVDLIFGNGFGFTQQPSSAILPGGAESYADGTIYTLLINYDYTASGTNPTAFVSLSGDSGMPLFDVYYYNDTSLYDNGVRLNTTNQFPDKDLYLLTFQAYVNVNDSGFSGKKFLIPNDFSKGSWTADGNSYYDYRTILNFVYTYLAFNLGWTTTFDSGGSGTTDFNSAYLAGYNTGYGEGLGENKYLQEENKNLLSRAETAEKNYNTIASENATLKTDKSNLEKEKSEFETTLNNAKRNSYDSGFNAGISTAKNATFTNLIGAVIDVPINAFLNLFNVEILGYNMQQLAVSLLSLAFVGVVLRVVLRIL